jgi:hypothetical protein
LITFMHGYVRGLWAKAALPQVAGVAAWLAATGVALAVVLFMAQRAFNPANLRRVAATLLDSRHGQLRTASASGLQAGLSASRRSPWGRVVLFALIGLLLVISDDVCHAAEPDWSIEPYYYFLHWVSMRRYDLALDQFTDDAVVVSGPGCPVARPCLGRAAIREGYLAALKSGGVSLPLPERLEGDRMKTRGEAVVLTECGHVVHLRGKQEFEFRGGRIASIHVVLDVKDPRTAAFMARQAALGALAHQP